MKCKTPCQSIAFGNIKAKNKKQVNQQENLPEFNGFIVIRFTKRYLYRPGDDLIRFCKENKLEPLLKFLTETGNVSATRVIKTKMLPKLRKLEERAANAELPPLRSLSSYWKLDFRKKPDMLDQYLKILIEFPFIEHAYKEHTASLPAINASDDTFATDQDYLSAAPTGIDARWAWTQSDCEGAGVGILDCEWGWVTSHEDLSSASPTVIHNSNCYGSGGSFGADWYNHGTAVLGEIVGIDNSTGIVGIAPAVDYVKMSSFYDAVTDDHADSSESIVAAILEMRAGDVMLLEIQKGFKPAEIDDTDFDAIRLAVANGIIVVEAAGNGNNNLDSWTDSSGNYRLNRTHSDFQDSGAILVGACVSATVSGAHERWSFSNYGSRIDCYAYGENVVSTGYGDLAGTADNNNYTEDFGGTSGASPMIVGCALILQGKYKAVNATILSPLQMRVILSDPTTGTPQGTNVAGHINVMPNLRAIIEDTLGLVPDVYLRDAVGDSGAIPSTGSISASPDIIVLPTDVPNPTLSFGEGSGTENSNLLGSIVEHGQNNFIYVRMKNRGAADANGVTASVYWSEVATLITPDMWNFIGTSSSVNVPVGDTLVVTDKIIWNKTEIPPTGHYCFVGLLNSALDPAPPIPPSAGFDWTDFYNLIRNYNNITWRNFNVEENLPDPPGTPSAFPFKITNAPDKRRRFDIKIIQKLPSDAELWLEIPYEAKGLLKGIEFLEVAEGKNKKTLKLKFPRLRCFRFNSVVLPAKVRIQCNFLLKRSKLFKNGTHYFGIQQLYEGFEVGGITWALKPNTKKSR